MTYTVIKTGIFVSITLMRVWNHFRTFLVPTDEPVFCVLAHSLMLVIA